MRKKFTDLKIGDPVFIVDIDGKLYSSTVYKITANAIYTNAIIVYVEDEYLTDFGCISNRHANYNMKKECDVIYNGNMIPVSDYNLALKVAIKHTNSTLVKYRGQLDKYITEALKLV